MDTVFGIKYEGGVVLAADQSNARGILLYQVNLDKVKEISSHSAMGVSGPNCDMINFCEYIAKNLKLYELSNEVSLSTHAQANFCRGELAQALRKGPYQVNVLLGGCNPKTKESELYYLDYMGALQKVDYGVQGYASNFCLSIMDKEYLKGRCTKEEALAIVEKCIHELHTRFLVQQKNFIIKVVDDTGVSVHSQGANPADN